jgi:hypothetical protein
MTNIGEEIAGTADNKMLTEMPRVEVQAYNTTKEKHK